MKNMIPSGRRKSRGNLADAKAEDVMIRNVITINAGDVVASAKLKMLRLGIGGLPVMENNKLVGMITHRDTILAGESAGGLRVKDVMTCNILTVGRKTPLKEIVAAMKETGYQRLPVVERKRLIGIVTQGSIINALALAGAQDPRSSARKTAYTPASSRKSCLRKAEQWQK